VAFDQLLGDKCHLISQLENPNPRNVSVVDVILIRTLDYIQPSHQNYINALKPKFHAQRLLATPVTPQPSLKCPVRVCFIENAFNKFKCTTMVPTRGNEYIQVEHQQFIRLMFILLLSHANLA
jgi:hypothetical protein